ncbi:MAG: SIR2 family protein [Thermodesulfovibrionales bacterium]
MSKTIEPLPTIPKEIENAAQSGELVVFVGAGISRLVKCPTWEGFANKILEQLVPDGIDYYELSQIKSIPDPKKKLSIARIIAKEKKIDLNYKEIFDVKTENPNIYSHLNKFNCTFVTTNYDKFLKPISRKSEPEDNWRFYQEEDLLREKLDVIGNVIHLHGCIDDDSKMVITTRDYIEHYSKPTVKEFLTYLFKNKRKTVLFLGYGLEEIEVLEYIHRQGGIADEGDLKLSPRRFILQGFFKAESALVEMLRKYYRETFGAELIDFPKDKKSYWYQEQILDRWSEKLIFGGMALTDEADAMEEEIDG